MNKSARLNRRWRFAVAKISRIRNMFRGIYQNCLNGRFRGHKKAELRIRIENKWIRIRPSKTPGFGSKIRYDSEPVFYQDGISENGAHV